jgi:hypothetical protein
MIDTTNKPKYWLALLRLGMPDADFARLAMPIPTEAERAEVRAEVAEAADEAVDVYDATRHDNITELPALTTRMDGQQFREWIAADGQIFIVYLPMRKSFIIKVPEQQHAFFVDMMKQLRMCLGPDVQAASAQAVDLEAGQ